MSVPYESVANTSKHELGCSPRCIFKQSYNKARRLIPSNRPKIHEGVNWMIPKVSQRFPLFPEHRNRRRVLLLTFWTVSVSVIVLPVARSSDEPSVGFIAAVQGPWISSRTGAPLRQVDPVFDGDQIAPKAPLSEGSFIAIALYDGTKATMRCRSASDCDAGYKVPHVNQPDSFLTRVTEAIRQLY